MYHRTRGITTSGLTVAILIIIVKEALVKVPMRIIEKLIIENTGIAVGILMLGGLEPEIHL